MAKASKKVCPRDNGELVHHDGRGFACEQCSTCSGILVDEVSLSHGLGQGGRKPKLPANLERSKVNCPGCKSFMRMLVHKGTEIDVCRTCGLFWLDKGELENLAKAPGKAGKRAAIAAGAVAGAAALGAAAAQTQAGAQGINWGEAVADVGLNVAGEVAGEVGGAAIEAVFSFLGEAIGAILS